MERLIRRKQRFNKMFEKSMDRELKYYREGTDKLWKMKEKLEEYERDIAKTLVKNWKKFN